MHTSSKRFLLVNPWISDVAAYNFWIRPLGLYAVAEWLYQRGAEFLLIDCLSPFEAPGRFDRRMAEQPKCFRKYGIKRRFCRYGISVEEFIFRLREGLSIAGSFDAVLMTSAISYWYPGVQWAVECIRKHLPGVPIFLGGIYPSLWPEHAEAHSGADRIFKGPLEFYSIELANVLGLPNNPIRKKLPWYRLGLHDGVAYSGIRTAYGCPFRCTYCASRIVSGDFRERRSVEIVHELTWLRRCGVSHVSFYDDALLVDFNNRLRPVLEELNKKNIRMAFHTPNALHARLVNSHVAHLLHISGFRTVRISLETVDVARQKATGGKVLNSDVEMAVRFLQEAGFKASDIGVYLLVGLPGQELEEIRAGIEMVRALGARPYLAELSPIPGTAVWSELEALGKVWQDMDPLLTNNSVFWEWSGFCSRQEFDELKQLCSESSSALAKAGTITT